MKKIVMVCMALLLIVGVGYFVGKTIKGSYSSTSVNSKVADDRKDKSEETRVVDPEPQEKGKEVNLYYVNEKYIETGDESLEKMVVIKKKIKYSSESLAEMVVRALLKKPEVEGVTTAVPKTVKLIDVKVDGDMAYVNFASDGLYGGSEQEDMIIKQIVNTLTKLDGIMRVQFLKDGKKEETLMGHENAMTPYCKELSLNELQLGELKLRMKRVEFLKKFSEPKSQRLEQNGKEEYLEYEDFKVVLINGEVSRISTTSDKLTGPRGIKVGASVEQIINAYGEPSSKRDGIFDYPIGPVYELLHIKLENDKVKEISINLAD